jgi:hypothetical protein
MANRARHLLDRLLNNIISKIISKPRAFRLAILFCLAGGSGVPTPMEDYPGETVFIPGRSETTRANPKPFLKYRQVMSCRGGNSESLTSGRTVAKNNTLIFIFPYCLSHPLIF